MSQTEQETQYSYQGQTVTIKPRGKGKNQWRIVLEDGSEKLVPKEEVTEITANPIPAVETQPSSSSDESNQPVQVESRETHDAKEDTDVETGTQDIGTETKSGEEAVIGAEQGEVRVELDVEAVKEQIRESLVLPAQDMINQLAERRLAKEATPVSDLPAEAPPVELHGPGPLVPDKPIPKAPTRLERRREAEELRRARMALRRPGQAHNHTGVELANDEHFRRILRNRTK